MNNILYFRKMKLYNIIVQIAYLFIQIVALFNHKINLFVTGRKETFSKLSSINSKDNVIWVHAASLGEFEQGRPLIEKLRKIYPTYKIVLTFFSPSGYEIRKNYQIADVVCYLPIDTQKKVKKFIKITHPKIAILIKYEFWPNLLNELKRTNTNTILVSGIFRKNQAFFKWYGGWMRNLLNTFTYFFVQDTTSKELLNKCQLTNVSISGDTRFDRVYEILQQDNFLPFINSFKNNKHTVVAGSTWKNDEDLFINYINEKASKNEKFIIAPHNIDKKEIKNTYNKINKKVVLYSELTLVKNKNLSEYQVFIIDTIGLLTKVYSYADVAYVGGGFKTGLHNILEPATFGVPIVFGGKKIAKFKEAIDLINLKGCKTIETQQDFSKTIKELYTNRNLKETMGTINENYVKHHIGATDIIFNYIKKQL